MKKVFCFGSCLLISVATLLTVFSARGEASGGNTPILVGEVREITWQGSHHDPPPTTMRFAIGYEFDGFDNGWPGLLVRLGADVEFPPDEPGLFVDYDAYNSPDFFAFLDYATNGQDDPFHLCFWAAPPAGCSGGPESYFFDDNFKAPDLAGKEFDFVRLLVYRLTLSNGDRTADWDLAWQFWKGSPVFSGGGQRADVDDFLVYANPLQKRMSLPAGTTQYTMTLFYGPTIDENTFRVDLNGEPFWGFTPLAGTSEMVPVPLMHGRNVLILSVDGFRSDEHTATDKDRLTFMVE
ncbi:hypothetical protein ACFLU6_11815 [Acidobacteriota bacterium]